MQNFFFEKLSWVCRAQPAQSPSWAELVLRMAKINADVFTNVNNLFYLGSQQWVFGPSVSTSWAGYIKSADPSEPGAFPSSGWQYWVNRWIPASTFQIEYSKPVNTYFVY